jgi:hypothetical protein
MVGKYSGAHMVVKSSYTITDYTMTIHILWDVASTNIDWALERHRREPEIPMG